MRLRVGLAFPAVWAFAALLTARTTSTEAPGLVTDSSGAAVPGASVAIKRLSTGEERRSTTNETGEYTFPLIETGDYRVRVEKSGFKSATLPRLHVELRQKARMDFTIELGQLSEMVEAGASSVALRTEDAAAGQVIDNRRVVELPLNGRDVQSLAALAPGVQFGLRAGPFAFRRVSCNIAARPDLCHFGGAGRNILASPGQRNLDGALFKNFSLSERAWLQFPPEFFNVFNTP